MTRMAVMGIVAVIGVSACAWRSPEVELVRLASQIPSTAVGYDDPGTDTMRGPTAEIIARLKSWGIGVVYGVAIEGAYGSANVARRTIYILPDLSVDAQFDVLAHEAGHFFHPPVIGTDVAELFAEMVSVGVAAHYGRDVRHSSARYLASRKHVFAAARYLTVDVRAAVASITGTGPPPSLRW